MSLLWEQVYDQLVAHVPTLAGWSTVKVFDGPPVRGANLGQTFIIFGISTLDTEDDSNGGIHLEASPVGNHFGAETGDVPALLVIGSGSTRDYSANRATAFSLARAWASWFLSDLSLGGVLPSDATVSLDVGIASRQNTKGTAYGLVLTTSYQCPTTT